MDAIVACPARGGRRARGRLGHARGRGDRDDRPLPEGAPGRGRGRLDRRDREGRRHDRAQHGDHAGVHPHRPGGAQGTSCAAMLTRAVEPTFNSISVDSDTSTSDTVALVSSGRVPCPDLAAFERALPRVCADLAEDVVRNGEGVRHVIRVCGRERGGLRRRRARSARRSSTPPSSSARSRATTPTSAGSCRPSASTSGLARPREPTSRSMRITVGGSRSSRAARSGSTPRRRRRSSPTCARPSSTRAPPPRRASSRRPSTSRRTSAASRSSVDLGRPAAPAAVVLGGGPDPRVRERERRLPELGARTRGVDSFHVVLVPRDFEAS